MTRGRQATETQQRPKGGKLNGKLAMHARLQPGAGYKSWATAWTACAAGAAGAASLGRTVENKVIQESEKQSTATPSVAIALTCCLSVGVPRWLSDSKSTVNQLMVQIQEPQFQVNSLNNARELSDRETASSAGLHHVPSQLMNSFRPRALISRDFCLQPAARNSFGTSGHVFEDLLAPVELSAAIFEISRNMASASREPVSVNTGRESCRASK